jgi:hypothetical protein
MIESLSTTIAGLTAAPECERFTGAVQTGSGLWAPAGRISPESNTAIARTKANRTIVLARRQWARENAADAIFTSLPSAKDSSLGTDRRLQL